MSIKEDKDFTYRLNMIKGRIAETLIEEFFIYSGYNVYRYGMENTIPGIMELIKTNNNGVSKHIRKMPDFVILNNQTGKVDFVEVKFRASGYFKYEDLGEDFPYDDCYMIILSKKNIKCLNVAELKKGEVITPNSNNLLTDRKEFSFNSDKSKEICEFLVTFFKEI